MASLNIHIERFFEDGELDFAGAIVDIIPIDVSEPVEDSEISNCLVPAGEAGQVTPATFDLPTGEYVVQARLPSGQVINHHLSLGDEGLDLALEAEQSTNEWLSWQSYLGETPTLEQRTKADYLRSIATLAKDAVQDALASDDSDSGPDDLTRLRGVSPKIAKVLLEHGVSRFSQIANLSERELGWLNDTVTGVQGRIGRYNWVSQAAELTPSSGEAATKSARPEARRYDALEMVPEDDPALQPEQRHLYLTEDGSAGPVPFFQSLNKVLAANRSEPRPLDDNAEMLWNGNPSPVSPAWQDLSPFGKIDSERGVFNWALRSNLPDLPDYIEQHARHTRVYILADDGQVQWLSALPLPWKDVRSENLIGLDVTFHRADRQETAISILPRDRKLAPLMGFLKSGDSRAARAIVQNARGSLFEKVRNPFAAAAGGYVLVNNLRWGADRNAVDNSWFPWIKNLKNWFPWLTDGHVLQAWLQLLTSEAHLEEARAGLLHAAEGGLPTYTGTFQLLIEGLQMFRDHAQEHDRQDQEVEEALLQLDLPAMRVDTRQIFTTIRLTPRSAPIV